MMTTVKQILEAKGGTFHAVRPTDSVFDALSLMAQFDIGCVLVTDGDKLVGIFTERDYARKVVLKGLASKDTKVGDLMTPNVLTVSPTHTIDDCMCIITNNHVRHLPVVDHGKVVGLISIGDAVKSVMEQQQATIDQLSGYIAGGLST